MHNRLAEQDEERLRYQLGNVLGIHAIRCACAGLGASSNDAPVEDVGVAAAEVGESRLIASDSQPWRVHLTRRRIAQLAPAAV
jgi:hypothetical protein